MRILTVRADVAKTVRAVHESVDPAAVLTVLMHKIMSAIDAEGIEEARALLQDWLVILLASYNRNIERERGTPLNSPAEVRSPAIRPQPSFSVLLQLHPLQLNVFMLSP